MVRSVGLDVEQNGLGFVWFPGSLPYIVRDPSACEIKRKEDNKFSASRDHQHVPFFRNHFSVTPGVPAAVEPDVGDIEVVTPPDLAVEPADAPGILPVEPAVEPSLDLGDRSLGAVQLRNSSRCSASHAARINCECQS